MSSVTEPDGRGHLVAFMLALWFGVHSVLSRQVGTCTMGDVDRFVGGALVGVPAALLAAGLLWRRPAVTPGQLLSLVLPAALIPVVVLEWTPLALSTTLQGHHLCGPEHDDLTAGAWSWERLIPAGHLACTAIMAMAALRSWKRGAAASLAHHE
ncbi:MAG: hypothetical protein AAF533_00760 [Acidobacteriota bacterium]